MVVMCPSFSDSITPPYPTTSRPTLATKYARVDRNASSLTNSDWVHGRGYTWASIRTTLRR